MKKILIILLLFLIVLIGCENKTYEETEENINVVDVEDDIKKDEIEEKKKLIFPLDSFAIGNIEDIKQEFENAGFEVVLNVSEMKQSECNWNEGDIISIYAFNKDDDSADIVSYFDVGDEISSNYSIAIEYVHINNDIETSESNSKEENSDYEYESEYVNPYTQLSKFEVRTRTEFSHIETGDMIMLGNKENLYIECTVSPSTALEDDILFIFEEGLFDYSLDDVVSINNNEIKYIFKVTANKVGYNDIYIFSSYTFVEEYYYEDGPEAIKIHVQKLDSNEGKVVYVSSTGEKYHYSEKCCGKNAIKTTLFDAEAYEYEKCNKCCK